MKPTKLPILKSCFLQTIFHNSDIFRCVFIIFKQFPNVNKNCMKYRRIIKYITILQM